MSHSEQRTTWHKEFLMSTLSGFAFGATNTIVGHPMDTVKTKMQTQSEHIARGGLSHTVR